ncbi:Putative lipid phosphate phosphatase 3, chloroplastic [Dionaea muscipula]
MEAPLPAAPLLAAWRNEAEEELGACTSWPHIFVHGVGDGCMVEYQARLQGPPTARMGLPQARTHAAACLDGGARIPSGCSLDKCCCPHGLVLLRCIWCCLLLLQTSVDMAWSFCYLFQGERILGHEHRAYTIQSHGARLARLHCRDWLILVLLVVLEVILNVIHPFYRFVGKDMMTDFRYPLKPNTVPVWSVPLYAVLLPIAIFVLFYIRRRNVYDLHHAILGLLYAVLISAVITDAIKDAVGRPRPDFFWRCFPDGKDEYDKLGNVICHGEASVIREGHKSFPSGHSSWSFAGLGFLSLYLSGKIKAFNGKGHVAKLCIVFLPLLVASLVAVSRVDDYWHHWQDVFAGGLLGLVVAFFCYLQFFPPPYNTDGWGPYAYFRALDQETNLAESARHINAPDDHHNNGAPISLSVAVDRAPDDDKPPDV